MQEKSPLRAGFVKSIVLVRTAATHRAGFLFLELSQQAPIPAANVVLGDKI